MIIPARYDSDIPDVAKQPYADLITSIDAVAGFTKHTLLPSAGGHPCYGYSIGDPVKPCIMILGAIHNPHEWKSAYGVRELMRVISNPSLYSSEQTLVQYLKDKYRFYFIPVVSPDSYENSTTTNENGVWINRNFDYNWDITPIEERGPFPFSENETINIRDVFLNENSAILIDNHTVGNFNDLLMMRENAIAELTTVVTDLLLDAETIYNDYNKLSNFVGFNYNSSAYNWASSQDGSLSDKAIGQVFEPGYGLTMNQLLSISVWGMVHFIANVDAWFDGPKGKRNKFFFDLSYLTGNS